MVSGSGALAVPGDGSHGVIQFYSSKQACLRKWALSRWYITHSEVQLLKCQLALSCCKPPGFSTAGGVHRLPSSSNESDEALAPGVE